MKPVNGTVGSNFRFCEEHITTSPFGPRPTMRQDHIKAYETNLKGFLE